MNSKGIFVRAIVGGIMLGSQLQATTNGPHSIQVPTQKVAIEQKVRHLLFVMQERLSLIEDATKYKWMHHLPVENLYREKLVLSTQASQFGPNEVDNEWIKKFLQGQINAARAIQSNSVELWKKEGITSFENLPDLYTEIRPELDRATKEMMSILEELGNDIYDPMIKNIANESRKSIPQGTILGTAWEKAIEPLTSL